MKFGAFVELAPGIEGLVPLGEMSHTKRVMRSDEIIKEGETVTVLVKDIDLKSRRIALSLKDAGDDPWALVAHKYPVGAILQGKVERREPFGLFVRLEDGVTGLLHRSRAEAHPEYPFEKLRVNDTASVQIAEINSAERRISLDVPNDSGNEDWKAFSANSAQASLGTLGGALGDKLRAAMEKKSKK
jgi:small subunit ribosomal protein S1